jgi:hypothetical protein
VARALLRGGGYRGFEDRGCGCGQLWVLSAKGDPYHCSGGQGEELVDPRGGRIVGVFR